jgi:hypothetical protein
MIKREGKNFQICLSEEPLTNLSDLSESFKGQKLPLCVQNHTKNQVSKHEYSKEI